MTPSEEKVLVRKIQGGDHQAFEQLLEAYETRVYRLALRYTGSISDAEDLTQEVFLGIYRGLGRFRGDSALGTWIYRVAMNHCLEYRRKKHIDVMPYDEELMIATADWRDNPVEYAGKREMSDRVEAAISRLSPQHRDVIVLHELQGLTYQEVAATLDVPVGTVKSRLSNALRKLRDLLGCYIYEGIAS
jgi:RNA polymerase sigma-70 factor (ECF subfamily)